MDSPPNERELDALAQSAMDTLQGSGFTYSYGSSPELLYAVGGSTMDWVYQQGKIDKKLGKIHLPNNTADFLCYIIKSTNVHYYIYLIWQSMYDLFSYRSRIH